MTKPKKKTGNKYFMHLLNLDPNAVYFWDRTGELRVFKNLDALTPAYKENMKKLKEGKETP